VRPGYQCFVTGPCDLNVQPGWRSSEVSPTLGTAWPKVDNRSFSEREERLGEREREMIAFTAKKSQAVWSSGSQWGVVPRNFSSFSVLI
jgi:hypothetical protein